MNLYKFHNKPETIHGHDEREIRVPSLAYDHAYARARTTGGRSPEKEATIAKSAKTAYEYAYHVVKGPWPPGENAISKDGQMAYSYAENVIGGAWPPGEKAIAQDPELAITYSDEVSNRRFAQAEPGMMTRAKKLLSRQEPGEDEDQEMLNYAFLSRLHDYILSYRLGGKVQAWYDLYKNIEVVLKKRR